MKRVLVLGVQVPFVRGGAEILCESLVQQINQLDGVEAELVQLPFKWYPENRIINDVMAWRLLDLTRADASDIDLVIPTKFPSYAVEHPNKVLWLVHQHRQFYDLEGTEYAPKPGNEMGRSIRNKIRQLDKKFIGECKQVYTIANTVTDRLKKYNDLDSTPIFPPPFLANRIQPISYGDKIVYIGRLGVIKRPDLLIEAAAKVKNARIQIIGKGQPADYERLEKLIQKHNMGDRAEVSGYVTDDELLNHIGTARAIFYAPLDEDYGYATIEGFLAMKPVITTNDSGEVARFLKQTRAGFLTGTDIDEIAKSVDCVYQMSEKELAGMAEPGYTVAKTITWDSVMQNLVLDHL